MRIVSNSWNFAAAVLFVGLLLGTTAAEAANFSYSGSFGQDDEVQFFLIEVNAPVLVTMQTFSFAGGGFAPVLSLFDTLAFGQVLIAEDRNGNTPPVCGTRAVDLATNSCWDGRLSLMLEHLGIYTLALTQDANLAAGVDLAADFTQAGTGNFTGPMFTGQTGSFLTAFGDQRSSQWSLDIAGADRVSQGDQVPEASTSTLSMIGLVATGLLALRRAA